MLSDRNKLGFPLDFSNSAMNGGWVGGIGLRSLCWKKEMMMINHYYINTVNTIAATDIAVVK